MEEVIASRAPYRLNLSGSFTDIEEYYNVHGGAIVEFAINKFARARIRVAKDDKIVVKQSALGVVEHGSVSDLNGISKFYRSIIEHFSPKSGFELDLESDVSYGSGLGSSSATIISIIGVLDEWLDTKMRTEEIAELAHVIERRQLNIHAGRQDPYSSAFGGLNYIRFSKDNVEVNKIKLNDDVTKELEEKVLLIGSGISRTSHTPIGDVIEGMRTNNPAMIEHLNAIKECANRMHKMLEKGSLDQLGEIMLEDWEHKRALANGISNEKIDHIFKIAMENGAEGGKLLGAGAGGHIAFSVKPEMKDKFISALSREELKIESLKLVPEGLVVSRI